MTGDVVRTFIDEVWNGAGLDLLDAEGESPCLARNSRLPAIARDLADLAGRRLGGMLATRRIQGWRGSVH